MKNFHIENADGSWGWSRVLYFRRRLLAVLVYATGTELCGRGLTLLINVNSPNWAPCVTFPLDRAAFRNVAGRVRRVFA